MLYRKTTLFVIFIITLQYSSAISCGKDAIIDSTQPERFEDVEWLLEAAIALGEMKRPTDARLYFWAFLFHRPENSRAWNGLGHTYLLTEEPRRALRYYEKGWTLGDLESLRYLATAYMKAEDAEGLRGIVRPMMANVSKHSDFALFVMTVANYEDDPSLLIEVFDHIDLRALAAVEGNARLLADFLRSFERDDLAKRVEQAIGGPLENAP